MAATTCSGPVKMGQSSIGLFIPQPQFCVSLHRHATIEENTKRSVRDWSCLGDSLMAERPAEEKSGVKSPNLAERVKEEMQAIAHTPKHGKETHGTSDDIDEDTPVEEVKGPGVFHRMKEEVEAIVEAIHPKNKDSPSHNCQRPTEESHILQLQCIEEFAQELEHELYLREQGHWIR